jgi:hypothetical protein
MLETAKSALPGHQLPESPTNSKHPAKLGEIEAVPRLGNVGYFHYRYLVDHLRSRGLSGGG